MPTLPPEPPRFSTTHCWPVSSDILAQNRRDSVSVGPPAGNQKDDPAAARLLPQKLEQPVGLIDVAPTILGLLDIETVLGGEHRRHPLELLTGDARHLQHGVQVDLRAVVEVEQAAVLLPQCRRLEGRGVAGLPLRLQLGAPSALVLDLHAQLLGIPLNRKP